MSTLVKHKMATVNLTSILAANLSDISDDSDMNFIYILPVNECQQCNNNEMTLAAVSTAADQLIPKQTLVT